MARLAKGFNCGTCNTFHRYDLYVYAHTRDVITHTCACGAQHKIVMLNAKQSRKGKVKK